MIKHTEKYKYILDRLISGGQTGVDRAALDVARELGIPTGGWCPAGRRSARGAIPARYPLIEASTPAYPQRTRLNIRDSDATLVISHGPPTGGTRLTITLATRLNRPCLVLDFSVSSVAAAQRSLLEWLQFVKPGVLNVAGPRASESPGIGRKVRTLLKSVLGPPISAVPAQEWPPKQPRTPNLPGIEQETKNQP
ncbi:MAG TPA: putative molybdenum carrier protein [Candidatus Ozemobacteraceae bacterium]|nr:putative molybdenum carrier protein [Candidatus Ozemobacteraceae bacterium]